MKITHKYHVTANARKNIKAMFDAGLTSAKVGRMNIYATATGAGQYDVTVIKRETKTVGRGPETVKDIYKVQM